MKKLFPPVAVLAVSLALSLGAVAETHSKSIDVGKAVQVNGTTLKEGTYKVEWDGNGPTTQVKFLQGKKQVATAQAQVKDLGKKTDSTSVILNNQGNVPTLNEIDFGGMTQGLVISGGNSTQPSGQ